MKSCHCDNLEGPRGYYAKEISQRKPNTVWSHFNMELKKQNKLIIKKKQKAQKQAHRYREQAHGCQRGMGGRSRGWGINK